jgi:enamine deaminase RidA (YjgF/YER057c/UK114 family)
VSAASPLSLDFMPPEALARQSAAWWGTVLGVGVFGAGRAAGIPDGVPRVNVGTPRLDAAGGVCEVWRAAAPLRAGSTGRLSYRCNEQVMFGCIELDEAEAAFAGAGSALQRISHEGYRTLFALADEAGYPGLARVWNYFPAINAETHGSERYWQFNAGRQDAFLASGRSAGGNVPAACALGAANGPLSLYFLALREAPRAIENPRQVCAYHYPEQYGPRSPTFARASLAAANGLPLLFVSGTASIVGHRTLHAGDARAQTEETLRNIEAVLAEARRATPACTLGLPELAYKVYVRDTADFAAVEASVRAQVGAHAPAVFLHADVCRADLLVEIEACGGGAIALENGR